MKRTSALWAFVYLACGNATTINQQETADAKQPYTSAQSQLLNFEFDGWLETDSVWNTNSTVRDQLLFTVGHLNGARAVGRLDKLVISNARTAATADGRTRVDYHAVLPVGWGNKQSFPSTYSFKLPLKVDWQSQGAFTEKYKENCVDFAAHEVDSGSMFYYYRPFTSGCTMDAADVAVFTANVTRSTENTTGKYPEFNKVWEDNALNAIAIFGKYEDGQTTSSDAGISAYNSFLRDVRTTLGAGVTTTPATVGSNPGVSAPDVTFTKALANGRTITVTALLVDNIRTASAAFYARYESLTPTADMIFYNGHAGLGDNVRALAQRGKWVSAQYLILFMNGCDTFAYVDGSLAQTRARLNPDDPSGTKYMDIVTNVMPAFFHEMPDSSLALIRGLADPANPRTYEALLGSIDPSQVVVVTGEEDNAFTPGGGGGGTFTGLDEKGTLSTGQEVRFETTALPAGKYIVQLAYDPSGSMKGDLDLYTRLGAAPTTAQWDCRPYGSSTYESCEVTVTTPTKLFLWVQAYSADNTAFTLTVK